MSNVHYKGSVFICACVHLSCMVVCLRIRGKICVLLFVFSWDVSWIAIPNHKSVRLCNAHSLSLSLPMDAQLLSIPRHNRHVKQHVTVTRWLVDVIVEGQPVFNPPNGCLRIWYYRCQTICIYLFTFVRILTYIRRDEKRMNPVHRDSERPNRYIKKERRMVASGYDVIAAGERICQKKRARNSERSIERERERARERDQQRTIHA